MPAVTKGETPVNLTITDISANGAMLDSQTVGKVDETIQLQFGLSAPN